MSDEAVLVERIAGGDDTAYADVVTRHLPSVGAYVMRMMNNHADADDVVQETFVRLWINASKYDPGAAKLTTWLHNIAHNLCIDYFRKHSRLVGEENVEHEETAPGPDDDLDTELAKGRVDRAMMALPERYRSALILCHYQGMSNRDAAEVLGLSVRALESLLVRARQKLREALKHEP